MKFLRIELHRIFSLVFNALQNRLNRRAKEQLSGGD